MATAKVKDGLVLRDTYLDGDEDLSEHPAVQETGAHWAVANGNYFSIPQVAKKIVPGVYKACWDQHRGPYLAPHVIVKDKLLHLPDSASEMVVQEIQQFWTLQPKFKARGLTFKRGVMMYGPPGSGKTATLGLLLEQVVNTHGGIGVLVDASNVGSMCLKMIRQVEPSRPIVVVMEDFDSLINGPNGHAGYLSLLDGEDQIDGVVFVATTNYPDQLPPRFMDRPSRFDLVIEVGMPTMDARRAYLMAKEPSLKDAELDMWVAESNGFSIAHLREMIVLCQCYGMTVKEAVDRLRKMMSDAEKRAEAAKPRFVQLPVSALG